MLIYEEKLFSLILDAMKREMGAEMEACSRLQAASTVEEENRLALIAQKRAYEQEIADIRERIRGLYENLVMGVIDKDDYFLFKSQYEDKIHTQEAEIATLDNGIKAIEQEAKRRKRLAKDAAALEQAPMLTQELIDRLIERVEVTKDKEVHIKFRFQAQEA